MPRNVPRRLFRLKTGTCGLSSTEAMVIEPAVKKQVWQASTAKPLETEFLHRAPCKRQHLVWREYVTRKISQVGLARSSLGDGNHADMLPEGGNDGPGQERATFAPSSSSTKRDIDDV